MAYRLNPYKILRFIVIVAFVSYAAVEFRGYLKRKNENTGTVAKTLEVRKDDFSNSDDVKNKLNGGTADQKAAGQNSTASNNVAVTEEKKDDNAQTASQQTENKEQENAGTAAAEAKAAAEKEAAEKAEAERKAAEAAKARQNAEAAKKAQELKRQQQAAAEKKKKEAAAVATAKAAEKDITKKIEDEKSKASTSEKRRYIQVATFQTESSAKRAADKLGGNFSVQAVKGTSGKTMYRIISVSTTDTGKLKSLEEEVKSKFGGGYLIRTAGS